MEIAKNVNLLEVISENGTYYPVLLTGGGEVVLIDTGYPGQTGALREAVKNAGYTLEDITKVLLTHQDMDHVGGAKTLSEMGAEIWAHEAEAPYIQGDKTPVKLADMESRYDQLTEGERALYERAKEGAKHFYVHIDRQLKDGETLDLCGGIKVIHTPGHTPGHMALLLEESNIIVAGDGANIADGKLVGANPAYTKDMNQAAESLQKMLDENPAAVVCYHGGMVRF